MTSSYSKSRKPRGFLTFTFFPPFLYGCLLLLSQPETHTYFNSQSQSAVTPSLLPMPTCLLWALALFVISCSSIFSLSWPFSLNYTVSTSYQPLSSLLVPDKLLERTLPHCVCLYFTTLFGSLKFGSSTCHSGETILSEVIGDFINQMLHPLLFPYCKLTTHSLKFSLWLPRHWAHQILFP